MMFASVIKSHEIAIEIAYDLHEGIYRFIWRRWAAFMIEDEQQWEWIDLQTGRAEFHVRTGRT